jgi:transcription elongation factor Elf1
MKTFSILQPLINPFSLFFFSIHFPCTLCIFVGSSQKSLDSHLKWKHVEAMCELCGKSFTCGANLNIHKTEVHKLKIRKSQKLGSSNEPKKFFCHICGKPYCSKQVLRKHMIKHNNEDSLVNKHMIEDPGEYKYKCSRHENCKKYFKTARQTEFLFRPIVF